MGEKLFISLANVLRKNKRRLILIRKKGNMPEEDNCITKKDWTYINYRINPFLVHYSFIFMLWNFKIFRKRPPKQITVAK